VGRLDLELFAPPSTELSSRGLKAGSIDMDMYVTPGEWLVTGTAAKKVSCLSPLPPHRQTIRRRWRVGDNGTARLSGALIISEADE
jgi:hypothetical protein